MIAAYEKGRLWSVGEPRRAASHPRRGGGAQRSGSGTPVGVDRSDDARHWGGPASVDSFGAGVVLQEAGQIEPGVDVEATVDELLDETFTSDLGDGG